MGYAFSVLGDFQIAEDAAQEAFVEAYLKIADLREPAAFSIWLRKIVFKQCDRLTRGKRALIVPMATLEGKCAEGPDPTHYVEEGEIRYTVLDAINQLKENERAVVTLFYIKDHSLEEVAGFLDVPVSTVKSRLHSARKRLKGELMTIAEGVLKQCAPDATFAKRVTEAIEVFTSKGPGNSSTGSDWDLKVKAKIGELLHSEEEGFRIAVELSRAKQARARTKAALHFGLYGDPSGKEHLERLMHDESPKVRNMALRAYATLIHPDGETPRNVWGIAKRASSVPSEVEKIVIMLNDENVKVRWYAVLALGAYVGLGSRVVDIGLNKALNDSVHKVQHTVAFQLGITCPSCRTSPKPDGQMAD
ncbi:sigma-70 family RNA polymerase sigma factor [Planctomycetota bacterium]